MLSLFDGRLKSRNFHEINLKYLKNFDSFLLLRGNKGNTRSYYFRTLRAVFNAAIKDKFTTYEYYPFGKLGFNVGALKEETKKRFLPDDFLEILKTQNLENAIDDFSRNIFLLQYYLHGISFIDLALLTKKNIAKLNDGKYILYKRQKLINNPNAKILQIKITPEIENLITKVSEHLKPVENYIFPIVSKEGYSGEKLYMHIKSRYHRINKRLKTLSQKLGFGNFNLTTYVSRHTVAMKLRNSKVDISIIQQIFGHSTLDTTQIYLDSFGNDEINKAVENL